MLDKHEFERRALGCAKRMHSIAYAILGNEADCEDGVSEALIRAWQRRASLREAQFFETWLTRILINVCRSMLRARRPQSELTDRAEEPPAANPDLQAALLALPLKYRLPLAMHYIEGYAVDEIAGLLRLPKTTVKWRMHAARGMMRKALTEGDDA